MNIAKNNTENRVIFFDNLRYFFVICVILQHASMAYNNSIWWPVADRDSSIIAEWLSAFFDAFTMPLLFYIAGYFALPAIQKRGAASFLNEKLKRLGIPWLICILTICPVLPLIYHYTRHNLTVTKSYWDLWLILLKNFAGFKVGIISSMNELMQNNEFYQRYMWFLSLLLLFFFVFSIVYILKRNWFDTADRPVSSEEPSVLATLKFLFIVGFLTFFFSVITTGAIILIFDPSDPEPLFSLGNIIQFRPSRLFIFIIYFGLGIITYKNKWIERGKFPGHFTTWGLSFIFMLLVYLYVLNAPIKSEEIYGPIFLLVLNFLTISTLGFFTSFAIKYWNRPSAVNRNLAANSYNMYLAHYIFVVVFQLVLFTIPGIPGLLKFGMVSALSILAAYIVSQFLIRPFPRISVAVAISLFITMALVIQPR